MSDEDFDSGVAAMNVASPAPSSLPRTRRRGDRSTGGRGDRRRSRVVVDSDEEEEFDDSAVQTPQTMLSITSRVSFSSAQFSASAR